jgi:hypothetical protein
MAIKLTRVHCTIVTIVRGDVILSLCRVRVSSTQRDLDFTSLGPRNLHKPFISRISVTLGACFAELSREDALAQGKASRKVPAARVPACTHGAGVRACRCLAWSTVTKGRPMHVFRRFPTRTAASRTSEPMLRASTSDESRASSITASPCGVGSRGTGGSLRRRFRHP